MTTADVWTIAIAGAAFALSVVNLVWQVVRTRYERPVLHVMAGATCTGAGDGSSSLAWEPWVSVTNVGEKPVTLTSLLFKIEAKSSEFKGGLTSVWKRSQQRRRTRQRFPGGLRATITRSGGSDRRRSASCRTRSQVGLRCRS